MSRYNVQYIPKTTPGHYLTGVTALNIPSVEGTGDWHFVNTFLVGADGNPPKTFFVAGENYISSNRWLGGEHVIECSEMLQKYKVPVSGEIWAADHYRALVDMVLSYISNDADLVMGIQLDDWLPESLEKERLISLLNRVYQLGGFDDGAWEKVQFWMRLQLQRE